MSNTRFTEAKNVVDWIQANVPDSKDPVADAIWWWCYRDTEALIDDTVKHIAQFLQDGIEPYTIQNVNVYLIDAEEFATDEDIENDLRKFFLGER